MKQLLRSGTKGRRSTNVVAFDETTKHEEGKKGRVQAREKASNITICESSQQLPSSQVGLAQPRLSGEHARIGLLIPIISSNSFAP
jgi:hypothetical protein